MVGDSSSRHPAYSLYLYGVIALGTAHLAFSISRLPQESTSPHWVVLASLTIISAAFTLKIPKINSKISASDIFIFSNMVLFGPAIGSITAALDGFMGSIRSRTTQRRMQYILFNMSTMAIAAAISGKLFELLMDGVPQIGGPTTDVSRLALPMGVMVLVYYLFNSGSVALIVSLDQRKKLLTVWRDNFLWSLVTYFTGAFVAILLVRNLTAITPALVIVVIPIILVTYLSYKTYVENIQEKEHNEELQNLYLSTVETLAMAVDAKDRTTHGHIRRVRAYAIELARLCGVNDADELAAIETGALLHDIGKLAIDDHILNKPGRLTRQEFEIMKLHAAAGGELLEQIPFPYPVARYVRAHHERWDGLGYPDGLKAEEIPLGARILSIADAFDAIRTPRPYKTSFALEDSMALLRTQAGTLFDPRLVGLFLEHIDCIEQEAAAAALNVPELPFRKKLESTLICGVDVHDPQQSAVSNNACTELLSLTSNLSSLGSGLELQDLLVMISCRLRRLLPFNTCAFFFNNGENKLKAAYASGEFADLLRDQTLILGRGISGWVAAYGWPMMNTCPALEFQEFKGDFSSLADVLVVPIERDGALLGTISLYARGPSLYTREHSTLLEIVARRVAPFVGRALDRETDRTNGQAMGPAIDTFSSLSSAADRMISDASERNSAFSLIYLEVKNLPHIAALSGGRHHDTNIESIIAFMREELRTQDLVFRIGKQGFIVLLDKSDREEALQCTARLLEHLQGTSVGILLGRDVLMKCRAGIASFPVDGSTIFDLLERAEHSLVTGKQRQDPVPERLPRSDTGDLDLFLEIPEMGRAPHVA